MANRPINSMQPMQQPMQMIDLNAEIMRIPAALLNSYRQEAGLADKDMPSFTTEEKVFFLQFHDIDH